MTTEQTRVTITKTKKTIADPVKPTAAPKRKAQKAKTKKKVQMKLCTLFVNGDQVGKPRKMPVSVEEELDVIDRLIVNLTEDVFDTYGLCPESIDVKQRLIFHRSKPDLYRQWL